HAVAGLLGQVFLNLDDRAFVGAHEGLEGLQGLEVFGEELVFPLLDAKPSSIGRIGHVKKSREGKADASQRGQSWLAEQLRQRLGAGPCGSRPIADVALASQ